MMDGYDPHQLDDLAQAMLRTASDVYPKEIKKFLQKEGNKAGKYLRAEIKATVRRRTGSTQKGVKRGKVWRDNEGTWKVRSYNRAHQSIPINQGHWTRNGSKFIPAAGFFSAATASVDREIVADVNDFIDDMLERGFVI